MAYLPCGDGGLACWGQQKYLDAQMTPQFDECYVNRGGIQSTVNNCSNGYPFTWRALYESINFTSTYLFRQTGKSQCIQNNNPANYGNVDTYSCNSNDGDQKWVNNGGGFRRKGSSFCINSNSPSNGKFLIMWSCDVSDNDQNWNWSPSQFYRVGTSQCIDVDNPTNQNLKRVYTWTCVGNANQKWDAVPV